ncbi:MAG: GNAT family N-acetyltransferase [Candidatus Wallbacteria bacterium]|nr:GNAT family N-acetyltransferase [Candidatus Wallbacteria bacterium]
MNAGPSAGFELREVQAVPEDLTDDLSPARLVGMKRFFLRAFLDGELAGIRTSLLVARDPGGRLLAAFTLSRMRVDLDCIAGPGIQAAASAARRLLPGFMQLELLMCGLPASMADHEAVFAPDISSDAADDLRRAAVERSMEIVRDERLAACVWKEFDATARAPWAASLEGCGFDWYASVPVSVQPVGWDSPASYEASLRSSYRRQLGANLERARAHGLEMEIDVDFAPYAGEFHPLYMQVLERSSTRLETLSPAFFRGLAGDGRVRFIRAVLDGRTAGGAICYVEAPDLLVFLYVGMDHSVQREVDLYFNLLKGIVDLAARHRVREIRWGQTSPDAKGRMGARLVPLWFAMRFRSPMVQSIVRLLRPALFPERSQIERRVFK